MDIRNVQKYVMGLYSATKFSTNRRSAQSLMDQAYGVVMFFIQNTTSQADISEISEWWDNDLRYRFNDMVYKVEEY